MSGYYSGDGLGLGKLGAAADRVRTEHPLASLGRGGLGQGLVTTPVRSALYLAGLASIPVLGYHGYKRNNSVGWALVWGIFGSLVWPVTVPVAFVQGFGKRKVGANRRRRRTSSRPVVRRRRTSRSRRRTSRRS